jgi:hypothetical protein
VLHEFPNPQVTSRNQNGVVQLGVGDSLITVYGLSEILRGFQTHLFTETTRLLNQYLSNN